MKKTIRLLALAFVATSMLLIGCNKKEETSSKPNETDPGNDTPTTLDVPTTPSNKVAVIELITGNGCPHCSLGHLKVYQTIAAHPAGQVIGINIHAGSSAGAYKTQFGTVINDTFNNVGYPAAVVNRHTFPGYSGIGVALSYGRISEVTDTILAQPACANVAAKATIDQATRKLTVEVAVYYTSNGTGSTNKLNVAILQDSVWGYQSGGSENPDYYDAENDSYCHMLMLRHLITGQWGEDIAPVTAGSKIGKKYTYTIPAQISNEDMVLKHLRVVAFVAENQRDIITACEAPITFR